MIARWIYAPLFFGGFIAGAMWVVSVGASLAWLAGLAVSAIAVSFAVERLVPYEPGWNQDQNDTRRDILHGLVNEGSILMLVLIVPVSAQWVPWPSLWPVEWPVAVQLGLAVVLVDAGITLIHFFSHRVDVLWRFHAVHHSVLRMYGFNGLLKHPIHQTVEVLGGTLPWLLLGIPVEMAALGAFAVTIQLLLQHSNVDMRIGALRYIWALAPVHRHHHVASAGEGDVNFGLFLTVWDVMLGTARFAPSTQVRTGAIGLDGQPDYPSGYIAQILKPFGR